MVINPFVHTYIKQYIEIMNNVVLKFTLALVKNVDISIQTEIQPKL